ncbi:hypothetical protein H257_17248 [Aphanomyces astaci]|uniref:Uncharacterized protein n=1 Tax=Aphanomyces astaci TaxID=112090 RepID=W4FFQ4_APHAT|nr:hypothetical protein H257_17248 [Aphanomyces astaci]ETV66280.1 hypothetical protein H257_17248 [Aphanomyces astaci]RQM28900.1 hypothetical protein B5M09_012964 [Aphanomyces astaci]|eukprot:XP_009844267.1 hypothetical protein H257_17248 [Aphanomyces astaci]
MTSKDKIKFMVPGCGFITWYSNFPNHVKAKHRHIPEHRNIRQLWVCIVNAAGELQVPVQSTRLNAVQPLYADDEANDVDDEALTMRLYEEDALAIASVRLQIYIVRHLGGDPVAILGELRRRFSAETQHEDQVSAVEFDSNVPDDMSTEELAPSGTGSPATSGAAILSDVAGAEAVKEAVAAAKRGRRLGRMAKQLT